MTSFDSSRVFSAFDGLVEHMQSIELPPLDTFHVSETVLPVFKTLLQQYADQYGRTKRDIASLRSAWTCISSVAPYTPSEPQAVLESSGSAILHSASSLPVAAPDAVTVTGVASGNSELENSRQLVHQLQQQISQFQNDLKTRKQQTAQLQDDLECCKKQNAHSQRALQSGIPHMAEGASALKHAIGQIELSVLSGTSAEENVEKVDETLMSIARGFLRRNKKYLIKVFEKHSVQANTGDAGLRKESLRAALKDAQFPSVSSALAISDEDLFRQIDVDDSGHVSFDEFSQFVLQRGSVENWMNSEHFVQILSESVVPLLEASFESKTNLTVAAQDDLMRALATLPPDQFQRALDVAAIGLTMQFESSQQSLNRTLKALTEQTERLSQSKFEVSKLACGSIDDFHKGLEARIGTSHNSPKHS
jgi:hypothetical protein